VAGGRGEAGRLRTHPLRRARRGFGGGFAAAGAAVKATRTAHAPAAAAHPHVGRKGEICLDASTRTSLSCGHAAAAPSCSDPTNWGTSPGDGRPSGPVPCGSCSMCGWEFGARRWVLQRVCAGGKGV
jgi:hypothetical protein